jgi:hypothetical protein
MRPILVDITPLNHGSGNLNPHNSMLVIIAYSRRDTFRYRQVIVCVSFHFGIVKPKQCDRLRDLMVRVLGYRFRGPGCDSGRYHII